MSSTLTVLHVTATAYSPTACTTCWSSFAIPLRHHCSAEMERDETHTKQLLPDIRIMCNALLCSSEDATSAHVACTLPRTKPHSKTAHVGQLAQDYGPADGLQQLLRLRLCVALNLSFKACRALNPRKSLTSQSEQSQYLAQQDTQYHEASHSPRAQAAPRESGGGIPRRHQKVPTALPQYQRRQPSQRM